MRKAKQMMAEGNHHIYGIAASLGYEPAFCFSKVLKKTEGVPPGEHIKGLS